MSTRQVKTFTVLSFFIFVVQSGCPRTNGERTDEDSLAKACAVWNSCERAWSEVSEYEVSEYSVGECMEEYMMLIALGYISANDPYMDCLKEAGGDCDKAYACLNEGHQPQSCDESTFEPRCEGNVAVWCMDGLINYWDCSRVGDILEMPYDFVCTLAYEEVFCDFPACEGNFVKCNGTFIEACVEGEMFLDDCSWYGATCQEMPEGAKCVGTGPACEESTWEDRCEGDTMLMCIGGREAGIDCSKIDQSFTCSTEAANPDFEEFYCVGKGSECVGGDSCDGSIIRYCYAGYIKTIDCKSIGFSTCHSDPSEGVAWCE